MRLPADSHLPEENVDEALSWEAVASLSVSLDLAPGLRPGLTNGVVLDLSFIPQYRHVDGITGHARWCPAGPPGATLVLAGRARDALEGLPARFTDIRPGLGGFECPSDGVLVVPVLAGVAELEAGDRQRGGGAAEAAGFDTEGRRPLGLLQDARQNIGASPADWTRRASPRRNGPGRCPPAPWPSTVPGRSPS